jgi:hypothetical protein
LGLLALYYGLAKRFSGPAGDLSMGFSIGIAFGTVILGVTVIKYQVMDLAMQALPQPPPIADVQAYTEQRMREKLATEGPQNPEGQAPNKKTEGKT